MILTCPACATRYLLDTRALGTRGRNVRCARCAHSWYELPPKRETDDAAGQAPADGEPLQGAQTPRPIPPGSNLPALIGAHRRRQGPLGWLALAVVVAAGSTAAIGYRERIVEAWPPAGRLYAVLQLPTAASAEAAFNVRNLASRRSLRDGQPVLTVSGQVVNLGATPRSVPPLHLALKDGEARALKEWRERLPGGLLAPGQAVPFRIELADPPESAVSLSVSFEAEG